MSTQRRHHDQDEPLLCPICGGRTDDVAGGPCTSCWEEAPGPGDDPPRRRGRSRTIRFTQEYPDE